MKRSYVLFVALLITALGAGCKSTPSPYPAWVSELPPGDAFWGIGMAKLTNDALGLETATTRASRDVARQISQLVQGMLIDYAMEAGLANDPVSNMHIENIGRNLVNYSLSGARVNKREKMPDGTWYIRVTITNEELERVVNTVYNNEAAAFAEWKRDKALERLNSMLNTPVQPGINSTD